MAIFTGWLRRRRRRPVAGCFSRGEKPGRLRPRLQSISAPFVWRAASYARTTTRTHQKKKPIEDKRGGRQSGDAPLACAATTCHLLRCESALARESSATGADVTCMLIQGGRGERSLDRARSHAPPWPADCATRHGVGTGAVGGGRLARPTCARFEKFVSARKHECFTFRRCLLTHLVNVFFWMASRSSAETTKKREQKH